MKFFHGLLLACPFVCLMAQTPPPNATAVPKPTVTMSIDAPKAGPAVPPDTVVLTVGDTTLTAAQFDRIIEALPEQYQAIARGPGRKQFADNVVKVLVLAQEGKKRKLDQTPDFQAQAMFQNANVLAGLAFTAINKDLKLDDAILHKYYDDHKSEFEEVHARHILIRMQGSTVPIRPGHKDLTDAEALAKAQEVVKRIKAGEDFAKVAAEESDDSGAATNGGDLPAFHHGQMVPSFEAAAFAMEPGQLSEPVKSQFGYHIIKLESKSTKTFADEKADIEKRLRPEQAQKAVQDLQESSKIVYNPDFFSAPKQ